MKFKYTPASLEGKSVHLLDTNIALQTKLSSPFLKTDCQTAFTNTVHKELERFGYPYQVWREAHPFVQLYWVKAEANWKRCMFLCELLFPILYADKFCKQTGSTYPSTMDEWRDSPIQQYRSAIDSSNNDVCIWLEAHAIARRFKLPVTLYTYDSDFKRFDRRVKEVLEVLETTFDPTTIERVDVIVLQPPTTVATGILAPVALPSITISGLALPLSPSAPLSTVLPLSTTTVLPLSTTPAPTSTATLSTPASTASTSSTAMTPAPTSTATSVSTPAFASTSSTTSTTTSSSST